MIPLLRALSFLANAGLFAAPALLLRLPPWASAGSVAAGFLLSYWACGRAPSGAPPGAEAMAAVGRARQRMGAQEPRFVRTVKGWTAAAVRAGRGYGLLLGDEVAPRHLEAVVAHEMAHHIARDLFWEPLTDGPARVLLDASRGPFRVLALPFLVAAAPLAKVTELNADRLAADALPSYGETLREAALRMGPGAGLFYPSLGQRARHVARGSKGSPRADERVP